MNAIWQGFLKAIELIITLDPEVLEITARTLVISISSTIIASLMCLPLGSLIHFNNFRGKRTLINLIQTFYSVPTVAVGLIVFLLFSRSGPLGFMELLFTPQVMIVGQVILISPVILGLVIAALSGVDKTAYETAIAIGASQFQATTIVIREARYAIYSALILGFGRAISEVGLALMVGGNIRGYTRVMTTAISLETSKGDIVLSVALGIILISIALIINFSLSRLQQRWR
ncbi:MAG: ABC transporter permease [Dehalococcoidia bacterium]|nr:ABC transporter permease [Dehalococcoidia bacterium]